jgi:hypothetical protein
MAFRGTLEKAQEQRNQRKKMVKVRHTPIGKKEREEFYR